MPRYRKLHTKTVESLDINDMPDDFHRLLWVLMPLCLCCEGRGIDNPAWVKSKLFPLRMDVTPDQVASAMDWFAGREMIFRYEVDGRSYFHVPTFSHYQGDTSKEAASEYPPPPSDSSQELVESSSGVTQERIPTNSTSDADSNSNSDAVLPAYAGPQDFPAWLEAVNTDSNKPAVVRRLFQHLFPGRDPPVYSYIGTASRKVGGYGRLAELLWQNSTRPPTGDVLAYVIGVAKGKSSLDSSLAAIDQALGDG